MAHKHEPDAPLSDEDRKFSAELRESIREGLAGDVLSEEESLARVWTIARRRSADDSK